ncbi:uncharacterized protein LOC128240997 isoform X3 [Mya arenaria]|uniref:uncharacterized protein LOC128240997 isoform X3 n=1 Tax=Mya arenaria TaxID=6604 RepID=UPI0022E555F1|nr:uncharacterized protein LOC128240997 isoform X3 [Mya arenaria]
MIVLFWFVFGTNIHFLVHSYSIEQQPTTWGNALCQLAFPVLNFSGSTPSIDSTEDISNLAIPGKGVWIGYYQAMVTYTYVGNGRRDQYEGHIYDVQSLGDCISATGCKTFGLWKSNTGLTCKCALGYTVFANISCNSHCNDSNFEFPCGIAETNIMSVYNTDNERIDTQSAVIPNSEYKRTWATASESCFAAGKYPATYTSILSTSFSGNVSGLERWTGVIRKLSVIKRTENFNPYEMSAVAVAVLQKNGTVVFEDRTQRRHNVCHSPLGGTSKTTPFSSTQTTPPTSITSLNKHTAISNTTASTKLYTVPLGTTTSLGTDDAGSTAGLAAGLSVSLVLLILGAIIVLLFLKRRGFLPECHKQTEETSNHSADTATDNSFMSTPIFESTTNTMHDLAASNHTYLALERTFDGVNKDDADQYAELDATEFDHYD